MPSVLIQRPSDEGFLHQEANGGISRDEITLAAGTYDSGSVVISDGGNYQLATQALVDADVDGNAKFAIVCRFTSSTAPVKAAGITRHASVKSSELITGAGLTVAEATPLLAKEHVIVRIAV
jgi:hypothetical protein